MEQPEADPRAIESAEAVRNAITNACIYGLSGTNKEITETEGEEKTKLPKLLAYSNKTIAHANLMFSTLIDPIDFNLVEAKDLGLTPPEDSQRGNVLYKTDVTKVGDVHIFKFPNRDTNPYLNGISAGLHRIFSGKPSTNVDIRFHCKPKSEPIIMDELVYNFTPPISRYEYNNIKELADQMKNFAEHQYPSYELDFLFPEKEKLLQFYLFPERMDSKKLFSSIYSSEYSQEVKYIADAKNIGGFDVLTVGHDINKIRNFLDDVSTKQHKIGFAYPTSADAELYLANELTKDPTAQIVGIGKANINGQDFYIYTGADREGIKIKEPEKNTVAQKITSLIKTPGLEPVPVGNR